MTGDVFLSHAQNGEDVVLWRALGTVREGRYVDVGANHPAVDSVSRAFYDRGWSGLLVEPNPEFAALLRSDRPRDTVEEVVASAIEGAVTLLVVPGTGLSTIMAEIGEGHARSGRDVVPVTVDSVPLSELLHRAGFDDGPIHFMSIDTEGAELSVLQSLDLRRHRPWVLVVEATAPTTTRQVHAEWEPLLLAAGYRFCLFDGLSRFYVAEEHADALGALLSYPACVFDEFETTGTRAIRESAARAERALAEADHRTKRLQAGLDACTEASARSEATAARLGAELEEIRRTLSWRVTSPLRAVRRGVASRLRR